MKVCEQCGEPLGSNQECEACLERVFEQVAEAMDEDRSREALARGERWLGGKGEEAPGVLRRRVELLAGLLREHFGGTYGGASASAVQAAAFALQYVANPVDLLPDFIAHAGFVDDIAVVGIAVAAIRPDLEKFCAFKGTDLASFGLA